MVGPLAYTFPWHCLFTWLQLSRSVHAWLTVRVKRTPEPCCRLQTLTICPPLPYYPAASLLPVYSEHGQYCRLPRPTDFGCNSSALPDLSVAAPTLLGHYLSSLVDLQRHSGRPQTVTATLTRSHHDFAITSHGEASSDELCGVLFASQQLYHGARSRNTDRLQFTVTEAAVTVWESTRYAEVGPRTSLAPSTSDRD